MSHRSKLGWFWILGGCAFALALRLIFFSEPLWLDELHTAWAVDCELTEVAHRSAIGNQAPFFFWLTWCIKSTVGLTEFSLRFVSLVAGLLLVLASGRLLTRWTGSIAASATAIVLIAISPICIFYATEARPYGILQLFGLLQIATFWHASRVILDENAEPQPIWPWIVEVALASSLLFYIHYTAVLIFAAEIVFVLFILVAKFARKHVWTSPLQKYFGMAFITAVLCLPILSSLSSTVLARKANWQSVSSIETLLNELAPTLLWTFALPATCLGVIFAVRQVSTQNQVCKRLLLLIGLCTVVPIAVAALGDHYQFAPLALSRYVVVSCVTAVIFAALVVGTLEQKWKQWLLAVLFVLISVAFNPMIRTFNETGHFANFRHEQWADPIEQINGGRNDLPVYLMANVLEDVSSRTNESQEFQDYLKFPVQGLYKVDNPERVVVLPSNVSDPFQANEIQQLAKRGGWLLFRARKESVDMVLESVEPQIEKCVSEIFASPDSDVVLVRIFVDD